MQVTRDDYVLTCRELADIMKLHPFSVARLARQGRIPGAFRFGGEWRFPTVRLMAWIADGGEHISDGRNGKRKGTA